MLLKLDIKYVLALKIMQVNIRRKLVRCETVTDVPFAKQYCRNGNLFGILAGCLGINIDRAAASAATMWLLSELRKPHRLRRK